MDQEKRFEGLSSTNFSWSILEYLDPYDGSYYLQLFATLASFIILRMFLGHMILNIACYDMSGNYLSKHLFWIYGN